MRVVKSRSIPNVPDERLTDSLAQLHRTLHTPEGLHEFSDPRRTLIDLGIKARKIRRELGIRGVPTPPCRFCDGPVHDYRG
jgi:hypothetical protein